MGTADLVPGVSGGTIAFLFGIYDELLFSIKTVTGNAIKLTLRGKFKTAFSAIPFQFLLPLAIGMISAVLSLVKVVTYLLENQPEYVWSAFFGLVLGSALVISKRVEGWNIYRIALLATSFLLTFVLLGLPVLDTTSSPVFLFGAGAIAITAMILPGISGSLILVILGQYETVIHAISDRKISQLIPFAFGAVFGLALFSRLLSWLLKNHHSAVIASMVGVMLGSLRRVWPWQIERDNGIIVSKMPDIDVLLVGPLLLIVTGFLVVILLEKQGIAKEHDDIDAPEFKEEIASQHD